MHYLLALIPLSALVDATFIRKWNLGGCGSSTSMRCNRIPSGRCCTTGRPMGGSVRIANMPSFVDLAVPYDGNRAADMMNDHERGHCSRVRFSDTQFGDLNCLTRNNLGTGIWIACGSRASAMNCISTHSHPKRDLDGFSTLDLSNFPDQGQPGYVDDEEATLPETSYHDVYGNQISFEDFNRLADEELEREANGTLHIMYPDLYPAPANIERRAEPIDLTVYVDKGCHGEILADIKEKNRCYNTVNGAGIELVTLPDNCAAAVYPQLDCQGDPLLDVGNGATAGCYDSINFSSALVTCS